ncbi:MAG: class I SAM-dependent methyltransferase [Candidatus Altiarchaeota archaeon]
MKQHDNLLSQKRRFNDISHVKEYVSSKTDSDFVRSYIDCRHNYFLSFLLEDVETPSDAMVLDLMSGHGRLSRVFSDKTCLVISLDLSLRMLENIEKHSSVPIQGNAYHIPLKNDSVDLLFTYGSLHHCANVEAILKEVHRVLKPAGVFAVDEPCDDSPLIHYFRKAIYSKSDRFDSQTERGFLSNELIDLLRKNNFRIDKMEKDALFEPFFYSNHLSWTKIFNILPMVEKIASMTYWIETLLSKLPVTDAMKSNIRILARRT